MRTSRPLFLTPAQVLRRRGQGRGPWGAASMHPRMRASEPSPNDHAIGCDLGLRFGMAVASIFPKKMRLAAFEEHADRTGLPELVMADIDHSGVQMQTGLQADGRDRFYRRHQPDRSMRRARGSELWRSWSRASGEIDKRSCGRNGNACCRCLSSQRWFPSDCRLVLGVYHRQSDSPIWPRRRSWAATGTARKDAPKARIRIPDLTARPDEIGRLSGALRGMVSALYNRIESQRTVCR